MTSSARSLCFFPGANTPTGFYSCFSDSELKNLRYACFLKEAPACGKTAFLSAVSEKAAGKGASSHLFLHPDNPDEISGLYFPHTHALILDGGMGPPCGRYPFIGGRRVCLSDFFDEEPLTREKETVLAHVGVLDACRKRAERLLSAAAHLSDLLFDAVLSAFSIGKISKRAAGIIRREIPKGKEETPGESSVRFLDSFTANGPVCLFDTADSLCGRIYEIEDSFGLAPFLLSPIKAAALRNGYDVIVCPAPLHPGAQTAHLLIPALSLGFVTSGKYAAYPGKPYRKIRLDAMADRDVLHPQRAAVRRWQKTLDALLENLRVAISEKVDAEKALSALYAPYMDFISLDLAARECSDRLSGV